MTWVAVGAVVVSGVTGAITRNQADTERNRAIGRQQREQEGRDKTIDKEVESERRALKDLQREYEGHTSISPEAAYSRKISERATASAIDKAMRTGSSAGSIMNYISSLTQKGQDVQERISATEAGRRRQAGAAAKEAGARAARAGLSGEFAKMGIQDTGRGRVLQEQQLINQAFAQDQASTSSMIGDMASILFMQQNGMFDGGMFGGGGGGGGRMADIVGKTSYGAY